MDTNLASPTRPRQRDRLFAVLNVRANLWVPLPDILALGIAQYNARILELRRLGNHIESKQEGDRSWFRLVTRPFADQKPAPLTPVGQALDEPDLLFAGGECHRDDG